MGFIDATVSSLAVSSMRESLDASLSEVQWISNAYLLMLSALVLVGGSFGDRFGLARVFGLGIVLFMIAALTCALSPSAEVLIAARGLQGTGAALMVPGSLAIISRAYPKEIRGRAIGIWAAASSIVTAAGPIFGGLALSFGDADVWRWIFAFYLPLGALTLWLLARAIETDQKQPDRGVDLLGAALAAIGLWLIAWSLTGTGNHSVLPGYAGLGCLVLLIFLWVESRTPAPMLDLGLFEDRGFSAVNLMTFVFYFGFLAVLFYLPMTVIAGWGLLEIEAAAAFAPLPIFIGGFSTLAGKLADRHGPRPLLTLGCLFAGIGFAALALVFPYQQFWTMVLPATICLGIGMAMIVAPLSTAVMGAVGDENSGAASGVNNAVSRMAGLFAVAAFGSIAATVYAQNGGTVSYGAISDAPGHVAAMDKGFAAICWVAAGLALLSAAITWFGVPAKRR